jgi:hypothetical protein
MEHQTRGAVVSPWIDPGWLDYKLDQEERAKASRLAPPWWVWIINPYVGAVVLFLLVCWWLS